MTPFVAEIIAVGGTAEHQLSTLEQNVPTLENELKFTGIQLDYKSAAGEGRAALKSALIRALDRSDIIFITGGVGMSAGEDTIEYVSKLLGFRLERNEAVLDEMKAMLREREVPYRPEFERVAYLPETCTVMDNDAGIAPGCYLSAGKQCIFIMPSRPLEFREMFQSSARPLITEFCGDITMTKSIRCFGLTREQLEDTIPDLLMQEKTAVAISGKGYDLKIKVSATADNRQNATRECTAMIKTIVDRVGSYIYTADADSLQQLAADQLKAQDLTVAIAEAGTRGAVMAILSNEHGAWERIAFNFSSTSTRAKEERLELSEKFLRKCEPVSERMSAAMAHAAQKQGNAAYGISVVCETVVDGSVSNGEKEAFCSVCDGKNVWTRHVLVNDRGMTADEMRLLLAQHTLDMLRRVIMARPEKMAGAADVSAVVDGGATALAAFGSAKNAAETAKPAEKVSATAEASAGGVKKYDPTKDAAEKKSKKRKKGKAAGIIILVVAICVFIGAIGYLIYERLDAEENKNLVSSLLDLYDKDGNDEEIEVPDDYPETHQNKFAELYAKNPDVAGYIEIKDTILSYPVVQTSDNDYYLRRNFLGESSQYGIPFVDYEVDLKNESTNTIIYGHNMHDAQMFGELMEYKNINYYRKHPVITFDSIYRDGDYKIIAMFIANVKESDGEVFNYHMFVEGNCEETENYIAECRKRSLITIEDDVTGNDKLLTLSTCSYEFTDARFVVVARKLRVGESEEVDTSTAKYNPNPLMPWRWYQLYAKEQIADSGVEENSSQSSAQNPAEDSNAESQQSSESSSQNSQSSQQSDGNSQQSSESSQQNSESSQQSSQSSQQSSQSSQQSSQSSQQSSQSSQQSSQSSQQSSQSSQQSSQSSQQSSQSSQQSSQSSQQSSQSSQQSSQSSQQSSQSSQQSSQSSQQSSQSSQQSSQSSQQSSQNSQQSSQPKPPVVTPPADEPEETEMYTVNGRKMTAHEAVSYMVMSEIGGSFNEEAIKAQAVTCYTYLKYHGPNVSGVGIHRTPTQKVKDIVSSVLGEYMVDSISGRPIAASYHAISAGVTNSAAMVWGGNVRNLVSVDSWLDVNAPNYQTTVVLSAEEVETLLSRNLGASFEGLEKSEWFRIIDYTTSDNLYVNKIKVGNITTTGRQIREKGLVKSGMLLRSAAFSVDYNESADSFTFTVKGYGHGVGLSQYGAHFFAGQGKDYKWILNHYFSNINIVM